MNVIDPLARIALLKVLDLLKVIDPLARIALLNVIHLLHVIDPLHVTDPLVGSFSLCCFSL